MRVRGITRNATARHGKVMGSMLGPNRVIAIKPLKVVPSAAISNVRH